MMEAMYLFLSKPKLIINGRQMLDAGPPEFGLDESLFMFCPKLSNGQAILNVIILIPKMGTC
jgi:hypothetical protein